MSLRVFPIVLFSHYANMETPRERVSRIFWRIKMTEKKIADPIEALSFDQKTIAADCGKSFAKNKLERMEIARSFSRMLGTDPTYEQWESARINWVAGHAEENPDLTGNAHDAAWSEFAKLLSDLFGQTKPKSTNPVSTKKAEERAKKAEELLEKYKDIKVYELRDMLTKSFEALAKNPENKDNKKKNKELDQVLKIRTSEENKAHGEELKKLRSDARELVGKCTDIEKLEAVIDILDQDTDVEYKIED